MVPVAEQPVTALTVTVYTPAIVDVAPVKVGAVLVDVKLPGPIQE